MLSYVVKRVTYVIPILLGVTLFVFSLVHLAPGDPLSAVVAPDTPRETVEQLKREYGFDRPLPVQYLTWLGRTLSGDLGRSTATGRPVAAEIAGAVLNTMVLALGASMVGFVFGSILGGLAGYHAGTSIDRIATVVSLVGISIPYYWLGIVLIVVFSVELNLLPAFGMGPEPAEGAFWGWDQIQHMILPVAALSVVPLGIVARTVRAAVAEVMGRDFVQALRARGLGERGVVRHVIKNVAPIALAVMGLQLGYLLAGSILVETVFSWPGTGFLLNDAIFRRDLPLLQGTILVLSIFFVVLNLIVDLLQAAFDPRMRRA